MFACFLRFSLLTRHSSLSIFSGRSFCHTVDHFRLVRLDFVDKTSGGRQRCIGKRRTSFFVSLQDERKSSTGIDEQSIEDNGFSISFGREREADPLRLHPGRPVAVNEASRHVLGGHIFASLFLYRTSAMIFVQKRDSSPSFPHRRQETIVGNLRSRGSRDEGRKEGKKEGRFVVLRLDSFTLFDRCCSSVIVDGLRSPPSHVLPRRKRKNRFPSKISKFEKRVARRWAGTMLPSLRLRSNGEMCSFSSHGIGKQGFLFFTVDRRVSRRANDVIVTHNVLPNWIESNQRERERARAMGDESRWSEFRSTNRSETSDSVFHLREFVRMNRNEMKTILGSLRRGTTRRSNEQGQGTRGTK